MNNKGQTLVLFIILLPIILILLILLINYGMVSFQKTKIENNVKDAIEYGLNLKLSNTLIGGNHLTDTDLKNKIEYLLNDNIEYDDLSIEIDTNSITINILVNNLNIIKLIPINSQYKLSYSGRIENGKIIIEGR